MLNYKNFRPSDDIYWLLNLACLKHTGMMLPDAYTENTNWTKDEDGKSKLLLKPQLLQPSCFNDLSLQIKRSMIVGDLKVLFNGKTNFKGGTNEGDIKRIKLKKFANSGLLTDLVSFESPTAPQRDFQLPKQRIGIHQHNERLSEYSFRSASDWDKSDFGNYVMRILFETDLTREDILKWKVGYAGAGDYSERINFPSFDSEGYCNFFTARAYAKKWPNYLNGPGNKDVIFNELYLDWTAPVTLVEGVFDAIVAGDNSIPILGSTLRKDSKLFQKIINERIPVYLALDPDAEKKALHIAKNLLEYGIEVHKIDVSPCKDVGEMTKEEFRNRKKEAESVTNDTFLLQAAQSI